MPASEAVPRVLTFRKKLLFSLVATLLTLSLVESAARIVETWRPTRTIDYGLGFDADSRVFVPSPEDPATYVTSPEKEFFFRRQAFSLRKPPGTLRIVALGGSSVNRLDGEFRVLERDLETALAPRYERVEVVNAGGLSYGSGRLVGVAIEAMAYDPDVVFLYEAHNEFAEMEQFHYASLESAPLRRAVARSAVGRLIRDFFIDRDLKRIGGEIGRQRARVGSKPEDFDLHGMTMFDVTPAQVDARMRALRENYAFIAGLCRAKGARFVVGSVPSNLVNPFLPEAPARQYEEVRDLLRRGRYDDAAALGRKILAEPICRHQSSDVENGIIRSLAKDLDVPLADVEAAVCAAEPHHVPGETLFADHCHLNERGNALLRETFEKVVIDLLRSPAAAPATSDGR